MRSGFERARVPYRLENSGVADSLASGLVMIPTVLTAVTKELAACGEEGLFEGFVH